MAIYKTEEPNQEPESMRLLLESLGAVVTPDLIFEFINQAINDKPVSTDASKAAAAFLVELIQAAKYGESWDKYKKRIGARKSSKKSFDAELVDIGHPAFTLIIEHLEKKHTREETIDLFRDHIFPGSDSQIGRWIDAIKPRAAKTLKFFNHVKNQSPK